MKRWALITIGLYLVTTLLLTIPVFLAFFGGQALVSTETKPMAETIAMFRKWGYWVWIGVSVLSQVLLLMVPVAASEGRPRRRRHVLVPVVTAAFLLAFVCVSGVTALSAGIWGDHCDKLFLIFGEGEDRAGLALLVYTVAAWAVWAMIFGRLARQMEPESLVRQLMGWLLRGSILELLVAVPSHIVTRHRGDCCAPMISFWGIATGITVMLLAFGPGVFYLFVGRMQRRQTQRIETSL